MINNQKEKMINDGLLYIKNNKNGEINFKKIAEYNNTEVSDYIKIWGNDFYNYHMELINHIKQDFENFLLQYQTNENCLYDVFYGYIMYAYCEPRFFQYCEIYNSINIEEYINKNQNSKNKEKIFEIIKYISIGMAHYLTFNNGELEDYEIEELLKESIRRLEKQL